MRARPTYRDISSTPTTGPVNAGPRRPALGPVQGGTPLTPDAVRPRRPARRPRARAVLHHAGFVLASAAALVVGGLSSAGAASAHAAAPARTTAAGPQALDFKRACAVTTVPGRDSCMTLLRTNVRHKAQSELRARAAVHRADQRNAHHRRKFHGHGESHRHHRCVRDRHVHLDGEPQRHGLHSPATAGQPGLRDRGYGKETLFGFSTSFLIDDNALNVS